MRVAALVLAVLSAAACTGGSVLRPVKPPPSTVARPARAVPAEPTLGSVRVHIPEASATSEPALPEAPEGYAASCAAAFPWGRRVARAFACIETPRQGTSIDVRPGDEIVVRGYAGGSFENNVVLEVVRIDPAGGLAGALAQGPLTYEAPDVGMPGAWEWRFRIPLVEPGTVRILAHFESPRDGARVAEASAEVVLW